MWNQNSVFIRKEKREEEEDEEKEEKRQKKKIEVNINTKCEQLKRIQIYGGSSWRYPIFQQTYKASYFC